MALKSRRGLVCRVVRKRFYVVGRASYHLNRLCGLAHALHRGVDCAAVQPDNTIAEAVGGTSRACRTATIAGCWNACSRGWTAHELFGRTAPQSPPSTRDGLLSSIPPAFESAQLAGLCVACYTFDGAHHVDLSTITGTNSHVAARKYPPEPRTEGRCLLDLNSGPLAKR
jgi:hypothetical protein